MAVTGTQTIREVVTDALEKIGVVDGESEPEAYEVAKGVRALNRMLKSWQNKGYNLWTYASQSVPLTTAASYTLDPVRPVRVHSVRLKRGAVETPMERLTRDEYDDLPMKSSQGMPTTWYFDRQREAARLYIWPVLATANGETLEITYERELEDMASPGDLNDTLDMPGEWWDAVVYGLAARLADDFMVNAPNVIARAERELSEALAADREGSVFFCGYD